MEDRQSYLETEMKTLHLMRPAASPFKDLSAMPLSPILTSTSILNGFLTLRDHDEAQRDKSDNILDDFFINTSAADEQRKSSPSSSKDAIVMKNILKSWRFKTIYRAWMSWYKYSFAASLNVLRQQQDYEQQQLQLQHTSDLEFLASLSVEDSSNASADLALALEVIEKLRSENGKLSHEVKNLLLRSFGIRSAACNVINNSKLKGREKKCEVDRRGRRIN